MAGATGPSGTYGPNDDAYMVIRVRRAAEDLRAAVDHYRGHGGSRVVYDDNPLVVTLGALAEIDKEHAIYANKEHDPGLFEPSGKVMKRIAGEFRNPDGPVRS